MKKSIKIAVIGGTGKSGKYLVQQLLKKGFSIKMLVRNPDKIIHENPQVESIIGDVNDYAVVRELLKTCNVVLSTLGLGIPASEPIIFSRATTNVLKAMKEEGIKRYIVTTGLNVDTPDDEKGIKTSTATAWMKSTFPFSTNDKQKEYQILSESDVLWTLVRLPMIELSDENPEVHISLKDCMGDKISSTALANFLIDEIEDVSYLKKAPFIYHQ